ncbi:MAG TPA: C1 family peptidase, partial [Gammaproteobacteria bacterium]|nr:C1 family peptidase [Gammaproteobacteria bacterium]
MKLSISHMIAASALTLSVNAFAIELNKPIAATIIIKNPRQMSMLQYGNQSALSMPAKKTVMLMNIKLNHRQKQILNQAPLKAEASLSQESEGLPKQYDRGMNGTPVLNQGLHGSCVTFANSAAIDALLGKGNYISPLCNLALGNYFEEKGYVPSGWDGSTGSIVLNQIMSFGIINMETQVSKTCGGLKNYPELDPYNIGGAMTLDEFKLYSENLNERIYWDPLLNMDERFEWKSSAQAKTLLSEVKKALAAQGTNLRLTFAVMLPADYCSAGACARYHTDNDTWALTQAIKNDPDPELGGHEMVITGYNDDALVVDDEGTTHRGILILRNSWGTDAGDQG